jgi:hypothetical protein
MIARSPCSLLINECFGSYSAIPLKDEVWDLSFLLNKHVYRSVNSAMA